MDVGRALRLTFVAIALAPGCSSCRRGGGLPPKPDGAAVVVTADATAPGGDVPLAPEAEPNDTLATAQKLALTPTAPAGVSATLHEGQGKTRDTDLFRIDVPPPEPGAAPAPAPAGDAAAPPAGPLRRLLRVDVRPEPTLALGLEALDDQGQALAATGGGQMGEALALPNLAVTPGTYYLRVRATPAAGAAPAGAYKLTARLAPLDAGGELEPNGKAAMATDLQPGAEAVGYYGWKHDQDWYRVPTAGVPEGSVLSADLEPAPGVTASLLVFDSVEQKVTEAHGRKEERVALRSVRLPTSEPYLFIVVRTDAGWNADVRYNLRLSAAPPKQGGEVEPNDDPAHAQELAPDAEGGAGAVSITGTLGRGDVDVFKYASPVPVELDVEATPPERVDIKLEVLAPDGKVLARSDTGRRREPERLPNVFVPGGAALVRLTAGKGDANLDEPYRLTIAARPPEPGAEHEPNDTSGAATLLPPGAVGGGLIAPRGDVDFWQATAAPDADGNVAVSVGGVPGLALDVRVRGASGKELARFKVAPGAAATPNSVATGGDGCCVVEIREATGKLANPRDRYALAVGK
jgi:hypothetical protein